jgi:hypothetical protein
MFPTMKTKSRSPRALAPSRVIGFTTLLTVNGEKMSKSLGKLFYHPEILAAMMPPPCAICSWEPLPQPDGFFHGSVGGSGPGDRPHS